ncbi:MAG: bifunctional diaminohydroxyphosphoribosylaminopyrimidine deaminase/5-amino-6-(5-phosphoribosylamino)uracil reductase RibD [Acidimicrobiales bacterium]
MARSVELAWAVRRVTPPNPWVGCVVVSGTDEPGGPSGPGGGVFEGATEAPGGRHAEIVALDAAGPRAGGSTMYVTLEPCAHHGRTPPCVDAIIRAGVRRVMVGVQDPDPLVSGRGLELLRAAGIEVTVGTAGPEVELQLAGYLKHRSTGRPLVVLKLGATLDGRTAAPDGSSQWITGEEARLDAHRLRAESDAVLVGAGTIRADDPSLTVRLPGGPDPLRPDPLRVVLGRAPEGARAHPLVEMSGDLGEVLDKLGSMGVLQLLVEGGARVAHGFHAAGLLDRYVVYIAPAFFGGVEARPMFDGPSAPGIEGIWRGRLASVERLGQDLKVEVLPAAPCDGEPAQPPPAPGGSRPPAPRTA